MVTGRHEAEESRAMSRRVVVGFSGGVTSAWCLGWALRNFPREEVIALFHDTKEEHPDTYRFLREMAAALGVSITERSDGRSVSQLFEDEGYLGNNQNTFCSRILKAEQGSAFVRELKAEGHDVYKVIGYSANERKRIDRMVGHCANGGITPLFPIVRENVDKQTCADWCVSLGVQPSAMYCWAEHANCIGCVRGGMAYWQAVDEHHPDVYEARAQAEVRFGHSIIRGGDRERVTLYQLRGRKLKRAVNQREKIELGACECGD
jgi:hypothetical protein